jgi:hypothetical protein
MSRRAITVFGIIAVVLAVSYAWQAVTDGGLVYWLNSAFWAFFAAYLLSAPWRVARRSRRDP